MKDYKNIFETVKKIGIWKVVILLMVGVLLLMIEIGDTGEKNNGETKNDNPDDISKQIDCIEYSEEKYVSELESKIKKMITSMERVSEAEVYVTIEGGIRKIVLTETPYNISNTTENDKNGGTRVINEEEKNYKTVYIKDENGNEEPFIVCIKMPEVKGVAVSVKGNVSAVDEKNIIDMINALTGVGINKISVIY